MNNRQTEPQANQTTVNKRRKIPAVSLHNDEHAAQLLSQFSFVRDNFDKLYEVQKIARCTAAARLETSRARYRDLYQQYCKYPFFVPIIEAAGQDVHPMYLQTPDLLPVEAQKARYIEIENLKHQIREMNARSDEYDRHGLQIESAMKQAEAFRQCLWRPVPQRSALPGFSCSPLPASSAVTSSPTNSAFSARSNN